MERIQRKVIIVGDESVGKTSLLCIIHCGKFYQGTTPPEGYCMKFEDHDEVPYQVYFWDTAGSTEYDRMRIHSYKDAHMCLILFDISNRDSFNNVQKRWLPELTKHCPKVSFIIVGSKIDLRSDPKLQSKTIAKEEGEELAREVSHYQYTEVSAKENVGVIELCNVVKLALLTEKKEEENSSQKRCAIQ